MTRQEIEKAISNINYGLHYEDCGNMVMITKLAAHQAMSALEKQIPKKPIDTWESDTERRRHHLCRWACPDCGTFLGFENKHCTECGTKIKWDVIA